MQQRLGGRSACVAVGTMQQAQGAYVVDVT